MDPSYLFADEPTGSLDSKNATVVMNIITEANDKLKSTVILVTHNQDFAKKARKQIYLSDGFIL